MYTCLCCKKQLSPNYGYTHNQQGERICNNCIKESLKKTYKCEDCGHLVSEHNTREVCENKIVCMNCFIDYDFCVCCREFQKNTINVISLDNVCQKCLEDKYKKCDNCENYCHEKTGKKFDNKFYCACCFSQNFFECKECQEFFDFDEESRRNGVCKKCYGSCGIYSCDYKPEPLFHFAKSKDENPFFIGVELEIGGSNFSELSKFLLEKEKFVYCKEDCSIGVGVEIVSHPGTLDFHMKTPVWENIFSYIKKFKMNTNNNCGLHFHISKKYFSKEMIKVLDYFVNNNVKFMEKRGGRRFNFYCQNQHKRSQDWGRNSGHLDCVNFSNEHTVELRFCDSTIYVEVFKSRLQFINELVIFCSRFTLEEIMAKDRMPDFKNKLKEKGL